jgi:hypothetical protein
MTPRGWQLSLMGGYGQKMSPSFYQGLNSRKPLVNVKSLCNWSPLGAGNLPSTGFGQLLLAEKLAFW